MSSSSLISSYLLFWLEILTTKVFYRKHCSEAIWASSFKIRANTEIQEQFSVRLTSQTSLLDMSGDVSPKCISVWLFAVEPLSFSCEI